MAMVPAPSMLEVVCRWSVTGGESSRGWLEREYAPVRIAVKPSGWLLFGAGCGMIGGGCNSRDIAAVHYPRIAGNEPRQVRSCGRVLLDEMRQRPFSE
jgi:hypothetical protein